MTEQHTRMFTRLWCPLMITWRAGYFKFPRKCLITIFFKLKMYLFITILQIYELSMSLSLTFEPQLNCSEEITSDSLKSSSTDE